MINLTGPQIGKKILNSCILMPGSRQTTLPTSPDVSPCNDIVLIFYVKIDHSVDRKGQDGFEAMSGMGLMIRLAIIIEFE